MGCGGGCRRISNRKESGAPPACAFDYIWRCVACPWKDGDSPALDALDICPPTLSGLDPSDCMPLLALLMPLCPPSLGRLENELEKWPSGADDADDSIEWAECAEC